MSTKYRTAPEVQEIAEGLIEDHHRRLIGWRIEYLFRDKATVTNGKTVLGTARIVKGRASFLARSNTIQITGDTGEMRTPTLSAPISSITAATCSSALDGMQPTFRQTPPRVA